MESKKIIYKNLFIKWKEAQRFGNQTYGYQRGNLGGRMDWEVGIGRYTLLYYTKSIGKEVLLYSSGKSIQYYVIAYMGKELEKEWMGVPIIAQQKRI